MSAHLDGGPAYPAPATPKTDMHGYDVTSGMSLRDWFAGQALSGFIACNDETIGRMSYAEIAERSFGFADAMLKAREAQP